MLQKTNMENDGLEQESALLGVHAQVSCQFVRINWVGQIKT